jgi:23S rRNA pseudouridine2605 synthase
MQSRLPTVWIAIIMFLLHPLWNAFVPRASASFGSSSFHVRFMSKSSSRTTKYDPFHLLSPPPRRRLRTSRASESSSSSSRQTKSSPPIKFKRPPLYRADRVLANRGWGSRTECFELLKHGRVSVMRDGEIQRVSGPSDRLDMNDMLWVDKKEVPSIPLLVVYHKPKWILSVLNDPKGRPCLDGVLTRPYDKLDLHPVGRLDYDTSGLLLFSSLGALTQRLLHPSHGITKQYVALVQGLVDRDSLEQKLRDGVVTSEGTHTAQLLNVSHLSQEESSQIWTNVRQTLPPEYDQEDLEDRRLLPPDDHDGDVLCLSRVCLEVKEGKHRMVRKMLANCGHGVVELKREKQGIIELGDLPVNQFRRLTPEEDQWAQALVPVNTRKKYKK